MNCGASAVSVLAMRINSINCRELAGVCIRVRKEKMMTVGERSFPLEWGRGEVSSFTGLYTEGTCIAT